VYVDKIDLGAANDVLSNTEFNWYGGNESDEFAGLRGPHTNAPFLAPTGCFMGTVEERTGVVQAEHGSTADHVPLSVPCCQ